PGHDAVRTSGAHQRVDYILRGTVRRDGDRVRITARLLDAQQNAQVWADSYDRRLEDIFAVQSEIATRVAAALDAEISSSVEARIARAPTENLVAYNLYLRGRYLWHRRTETALLQSALLRAGSGGGFCLRARLGGCRGCVRRTR